MSADPPADRTGPWAVVVPVKGGALAKTRLDRPAAERAALAAAFARDTLAAVRAGMPRAHLLVVSSAPEVGVWVAAADGAVVGGAVVADPGTGLDGAVAAGVRVATAAGAARVAVLLGDHPALRPHELPAALRACAAHRFAVVADADGTGTALLTLPAGPPPRTAFGPGSAAAHAALGFTPVQVDTPGLRLDVDDAASLRAAVALGVGRHTAAVLGRASLPDVQATISRVDDDGSGRALLDDGVEVGVPAGSAAAAGLLHLRVGQRVSVELDEAGRTATRVWLVGIGPGETIR